MVSLIILSYNTKELLSQCLSSLFGHLSGQYEVIVVDNNSSDDSVNLVKKSFPKVKLIESKKNLGFAGGCNLGAKEAKGENLLFLNSDVEVTGDILKPLEETLKQHEKAAVVGGVLNNIDGSKQRSFGVFYTIPNIARLLFRGEIISQTEKEKQVDWVSGGCLLVKKSVFDQVGGFDEDFFMYIEDVEFCYRVHKAGYEVFVNPEARAKHVGQGSSDKTFAVVSIYKGLQLFYHKHFSIAALVVVKFLLALKGVLSLGIGLVTFNRYLIRTYTQALKTL